MNKITIKKILLPFLPDNTELQKYWWHRLAMVICLFCSILFILLISALIYNYASTNHRGSLFEYEQAIKAGYSPQEAVHNLHEADGTTDWLNILYIGPKVDGMIQKGYSQVDINKQVNNELKSKDEQSNYAQAEMELWFIIIGFMGFVVLPPLIYRTILFIFTNNSWKKLK